MSLFNYTILFVKLFELSLFYKYNQTSVARTPMARTPWIARSVFFCPVNFAFNSLSNKARFLEQPNYFYGAVKINQYKLDFQTRTQIHSEVSNILSYIYLRGH